VCTRTEIKAAFIRKKTEWDFLCTVVSWHFQGHCRISPTLLNHRNGVQTYSLSHANFFFFYPVSHINLDSEHNSCRSFSQHFCGTTNSITSQHWKSSHSKDFLQTKKSQILMILLNKFMLHISFFFFFSVETRHYFIVTKKIYFKPISLYLWIRWNYNNLIGQTETWTLFYTTEKFAH